MKLRPDQDAIGQAMYAQYTGAEGFELIERSDGYISANSTGATYVDPYRDWVACERRAIRHARGRVLDIGCGAGRHAVYLQELGHDVLGTDISPLALKVARERGLRKTRLMPVTKIARRLGTFDTILMLGNNFGLFANAGRARRLLRRFQGMMPPDGRIIASSLDIYQTDDKAHLAYQRENRRRGRMSGQIRLRVRFGRYATPYFDYLMVSLREMETIAAEAGWRIARHYDGPGPLYAAVLEPA